MASYPPPANRPNTYTPGQPVPFEVQAVGRPVSLFTTAGQIIAGTVTKVAEITADGVALYDVKAINGGIFREQRIGSLNNPQPNTFVYTP